MFYLLSCFYFSFFFFQAEDGIRDLYVTGVQTCALPICSDVGGLQAVRGADGELELVHVAEEVLVQLGPRPRLVALGGLLFRRRHGEVREQRSEERRVGKEWRSGWTADDVRREMEVT